MIKKLKERKGDSFVGHAWGIILFAAVLGIVIGFTPYYFCKSNQDTFANELCRTAELSGRIGSETEERAQELEQQFGLSPQITWSQTGNIPLGTTVTVKLYSVYNFKIGNLGSVSMPMNSKASGKSEEYWK
jgi:hypothetical protein